MLQLHLQRCLSPARARLRLRDATGRLNQNKRHVDISATIHTMEILYWTKFSLKIMPYYRNTDNKRMHLSLERAVSTYGFFPLSEKDRNRAGTDRWKIIFVVVVI